MHAKPPFGLSPALACLLVMLTMGVIMSALYSRHAVFPRTSPVIMGQEWEEGLAKAIETRLNSGQNVLQIAFFESTNARSWPSSNNSFGLLTTKGLRN